MKAAVLRGYGEPLSIEDVTLGAVGPHEVVVEVAASGVCHSDLTIASGSVPLPLPMILGHEGCGRIVEVGTEVRGLKTGDRVIAAFNAACGACWYCRHTLSNLCEHTVSVMLNEKGVLGDRATVMAASGLGTFAETMLVDQTMVVKVETDIPSDELALIGCGVTTGVGAVFNTAQVVPGSTVAVFGCGGVGQSVVQGARIAGAARIFAVDPVAMKREKALELGATDAVDPAEDPLEPIRTATGGRGADYVFEVVGQPSVLNQAYEAARRGGTVVAVGMPAQDATVTFSNFSLFWDEKRILGCNYGSAQIHRDFPRLVGLIEAGRLDVAALVSKRIALADVNGAFADMTAGSAIRSVICAPS